MSSQKYTFNYYAERLGVLSEMARPSKQLVGPAGAKMSEYIKKISSIIKLGGDIQDFNITTGDQETVNVPGYAGNTQNRVLRYIVHAISEFENLNTREQPQERTTATGLKKTKVVDGLTAAALTLAGINDQTATATGLNPNQLFSKAIAKWATENPEKVMSSEFSEELLNQQNILFYLKNNRSANTATGRRKDEELQAAHGGKSVEEIHAASQKIRPLIAQINKLHKYEELRKNPKYQEMTADSESGLHNEETGNITKILFNLESFMALKKVLVKMLGINFENFGQFNVGMFDRISAINDMLPSPLGENELISLAALGTEKNGSNILNDLYEDFELYLDSGIDRSEFESIMDDSIDFAPDNAKPFLEFLKSDLLPRGDTSSDFPGFNDQILKQVLGEDPENWEAFAEYYNWLQNEKYRTSKVANNKKLSRDNDKKFEDYRGLLPELRRNYLEFIKRWEQISKQRQLKYANSLKVDDDDVLSNANVSKNDLGDDDWSSTSFTDENGKPIKRKKSNYQESYVMGYMTEQIHKDKFKPKGEFKDRGFKKMNYLQWLEKNQ